MNQLMNDGGVCRAAPGFAGSAKDTNKTLETHINKLYQDQQR